MKQITAIFRPTRLDAIEQALHLPGFTILPAHGHPRGHGKDHSYTADEWNPSAHQHFVLMAFCSDDVADEILHVIKKAAHTGVPGDGIVAVAPLADALRIRTGERGDAAL